MDIVAFKSVLSELALVGVNEVVLDNKGETTLLRGSNEQKTILIYHSIPHIFAKTSIGIRNVNAVLSRLNLFDEAKASIEMTNGTDGNVGVINFKQGRKRASYRCYSPKACAAPQFIPEDTLSPNEAWMELPKAYVEFVTSAVSAMAYTGNKDKRTIGIKISDESMEINIFDGEDDTFTDTVPIDVDVDRDGTYDVASFTKLMKVSVSASRNEDNAMFRIAESGVGVFRTETLDFLLHPMVS